MVIEGVPRTFTYVVLAAAALLAVIEVTATRSGPSAVKPDSPWMTPLRDMDQALARGDLASAVAARHEAYRAATTSRQWEGYLAVGDAVLRLAEATRNRSGAESDVRRLYAPALFRARGQQSLDGVLLVTEAFARLGDLEAVELGLGMARDLAGSDPTAQARVRRAEDRVIRARGAGRERSADASSTEGAVAQGVR